MDGYNIAIVGATGLVGQAMISLLELGELPVKSLKLLASERSVGKEFDFKGRKCVVEETTDSSFEGIDIAFFSAGGKISKRFAEVAVAAGSVVIDNTSAFRMDEDIPLIVPEVNGHVLSRDSKLIANPNCSTIQLVVALKALVDEYGIEDVNVATYQAISGAGAQAVSEYERQLEEGIDGDVKPFFNNVIPQIDVFDDSGYTFEELKMVNETRKILDDDSLKVNATCVRVPVRNCHSVAVSVKCKSDVSTNSVVEVFAASDVVVGNGREEDVYPMPVDVDGRRAVFVGRVRRDLFDSRVVHFFVVADNLLKGAALNSVQIACYMHGKGLVESGG